MNKLSKEAKIGLGVLGILMLVFVVVLVGRLIGSGGDKAVATEEQVKPVAPPAAAKEPPQRGRPTVVSPQNAPGQRPKVTPADVTRLSVAVDDAAATPATATARTPTPSLMPDPPQARAADPSERYGSAHGGSTPRTYDGGAVEVADAGTGSPTADPFRGRAMQHPTAAEGTGQPYGALRMPDRTATGTVEGRLPAGATATDGHDSGAAAGRVPASLPSATYGRDSRPSYSTASADGGRSYATDDRAAGPPYRSAAVAPQYGSSYSDVSAGTDGRSAGSGATYAARDGRRDDGTYEVQPNENYWTISEKLYGTGAYFKALAEHNRRKSARDERLQVGDVIATPELAQLEKSYPDLCPKPSRREAAKRQMTTVSSRPTTGGRTYLTQEGDTLYDIARSELGKAARWAEIYDLNRDLIGSDYHYLRPGLQLALPEGDAAEQPGRVTRSAGPEGTFRR